MGGVCLPGKLGKQELLALLEMVAKGKATNTKYIICSQFSPLTQIAPLGGISCVFVSQMGQECRLESSARYSKSRPNR